jgi:hypothetical protein
VSGRRGRLIGLALTLVFLVLAVRRVDLDGFADALRHFNYVWLAGYVRAQEFFGTLALGVCGADAAAALAFALVSHAVQ